MFDETLSSERNRLLSYFNLNSQFVTLQEINENPELEPVYKIYLNAEVKYRIYQEKLLRESNLSFNHSNNGIIELYNKLDELYLANARYPIEDFKTVINNAVAIRINYLLRPTFTLKWFIFHDEVKKTIEEIMLKLSYFKDYSYLISGLNSWLKQKMASTIDCSTFEFENTIQNLERKELTQINSEKLLELLIPVFELFNKESDLKNGKIPAEVLIIYFDDKGLIAISKKLSELKVIKNLNDIYYQNLIPTLENILNNLYEQTDKIDVNDETAKGKSFDLKDDLELKTIPQKTLTEIELINDELNTDIKKEETEDDIFIAVFDNLSKELLKMEFLNTGHFPTPNPGEKFSSFKKNIDNPQSRTE